MSKCIYNIYKHKNITSCYSVSCKNVHEQVNAFMYSCFVVAHIFINAHVVYIIVATAYNKKYFLKKI